MRGQRRSIRISPLKAIYSVVAMFMFVFTAGFIYKMLFYLDAYRNAELIFFNLYRLPAAPVLWAIYLGVGTLLIIESRYLFNLARFGHL